MNCKPGDLAVVVKSYKNFNLGRLVTCMHIRKVNYIHGPEKGWVTSPMLKNVRGEEVPVPDSYLRPILNPGDDAVDEMLRPLPEVVGETGAVW